MGDAWGERRKKKEGWGASQRYIVSSACQAAYFSHIHCNSDSSKNLITGNNTIIRTNDSCSDESINHAFTIDISRIRNKIQYKSPVSLSMDTISCSRSVFLSICWIGPITFAPLKSDIKILNNLVIHLFLDGI